MPIGLDMNKPACLKKILFLSTTIFFSSCGGGNSKAPTEFSATSPLEEERNLSGVEINIATRICYAYQSKSQKFRTSEFYGKAFNFKGKKTDCQNVINNYDIPTVLKYDDQNSLAYTTSATFDSTLKVNRKVQTDTSGYLAQLCPKVLTNQVVSNTSTLQNVKAQISFFTDGQDQTDGYMIKYFVRQTDGSFVFDSGEKFKSPTEVSPTGGRIRGMDQYYSSSKVCPSSLDKNTLSEFVQTFTLP